MKNKLLSNAVIAGALCMALSVPSFVLGAEVLPVSAEDKRIVPISHELKHWAEMYVDRLSEGFDIEPVYNDKT